MRTLFAILFLLLFLPAQVTTHPTGCDRFLGPPVVEVHSLYDAPPSLTGGWDTLVVSELRPGDIAVIYLGFFGATTISGTGLPLPLDLGLLVHPSLAGCSIHTSMDVYVLAAAQPVQVPSGVQWEARAWVYFPPLLPTLTVQALVPDDGPVGWIWTHNYLQYSFLD